ncbi:hypothetical protein [Streptomyces sp. NPDC001380]|uniref:hypothetical protein n=1 Tax=Streptomyces sp. NPDC001380 TaxID=3364566 RepID=UPI0036BF4994
MAVVLDVGGLRRVGEQLAGARGVAPDEAGRGKRFAVVVQRTPQHLQEVGSLRAREPGDVAEVELGDRQQGVRPGARRVSGLEPVEVGTLVGGEEVLA